MKAKDLLIQMIFGILMLPLFIHFGVDNVLRYIIYFVLIVLFVKMVYLLNGYYSYRKNMTIKKYKWYVNLFAFIIGFLIWSIYVRKKYE